MRLSEFIVSNRAAIIAAWAKDVRDAALLSIEPLSQPALIDHVPRLLDDFADVIGAFDEDPALAKHADDHADEHAWDRIEQGFRLTHVVTELSLLRACILRLWRQIYPNVSVDDSDLLSRVVERAIARSAERYFEGRSRFMEGMEQIADAAFNVDDLEAFLNRLLTIFMKHAPSIDSTTILLREGDRLTVRASVGLEDEVRQRFTMKIGEGFSGTIAATGKPQTLENAWGNPLVRSPSIRQRRTRALYGVPLSDRGTVVGVAHIGSKTLGQIPPREKRLFAALAQRSTSAIIKHRLREEARLREAEFEAVIEAIPSAIFVGNHQRIYSANAAGLRMLGVSRREELGGALPALSRHLDVRDPATGSVMPLEARPYARALQGEKCASDMLLRHSEMGEDRIMRAHAGPIMNRGAVVGAVEVLFDITELHRALEDLKHAGEFRERFIGIVSHDLRNPLGTISMATGVLLRSPEIPLSFARPLGRILASVDRMTKMIADLLDFTRGRLGGGIPINPTSVDLAKVTRRVIDEYEQTHPTRRFECETRGDTQGTWDEERLAQVAGNLIGNAVQYGSPAKPVCVRIEGTSEEGTSEVTLLVENAGPPIPADILPHIFEVFRRAHTPESAPGGLGLGLFIASEITHAHGGSIHAASDEKGTRFVVTLPRRSSSTPRDRFTSYSGSP